MTGMLVILSNSVRYPSVEIFAKNLFPEFGLGVGDGATCIEVSVQVCTAIVDFRRDTFVGELYEGGTAVQV